MVERGRSRNTRLVVVEAPANQPTERNEERAAQQIVAKKFSTAARKHLRGATFGSPQLLAAQDMAAVLHADGVAQINFVAIASASDPARQAEQIIFSLMDITTLKGHVSAINETIRTRKQTIPHYEESSGFFEKLVDDVIDDLGLAFLPPKVEQEDMAGDEADGKARIFLGKALSGIIEDIINPQNSGQS